MYLRIKSFGEIEVNAIALMGASPKRTQVGKIGQYGTGNKYALSYLLRNQFDIRIYSGLTPLEITTKTEVLGSNQYEVIVINGKETSITTQLGKDWQLWMAIRELYSNAVDEGLLHFDMVDEVIPEAGTTSYCIKVNDDLMTLWFNMSDYIAMDKRLLFENSKGKIYMKSNKGGNIYRRGIRVVPDNYNESMFDYDFNELHINEERLSDYSWEIGEKIWDLLYSCTNELVIRAILNNKHIGLLEDCNSGSFFTSMPSLISEKWVEMLQEMQIAPSGLEEFINVADRIKTSFVSKRLYNDLIIKHGEKVKKPKELRQNDEEPFRDYNMTPEETAQFNDVMNFLTSVRYIIPYPIRMVTFANNNVMGRALKGEILISDRNFKEGEHYLINTIIEEYIHLKHGVKDNTMEFQTAAINELVTFMRTAIKK